ncbi:GNAT family N-acetyltransferase [Nocardioides pacificus]
MDIKQVDPDSAEAVRDFVTVTNAVRRVDSPWSHPMTERGCAGQLRHGWDEEPAIGFVGYQDGEPVATGECSVSEWDNLHLAWLDVSVAPERRRAGHGSAMLEALSGRARELGRTSIGIGGWESAATRTFAEHHKLDFKGREVCRRQVVTQLDVAALDLVHEQARTAASSYEMVRWLAHTPEDQVDPVAVMTGAINDAPTDDLDIEDEVFAPQRIRDYEAAQEAQGHLLHRVVARHRETGELAGQSVVAVYLERPELGEQHDTSVVRAHRGHRLGLLLKLEVLRWLRETQPQLVSIDTWNAESNDHMIGVNELLGYRVLGYTPLFQRSL